MNKPELRFPEFSEEWKKKELGDVAKFSKGKGIGKSDIEENGVLECIRYGELYTHYGEVIEDIISRTNVDKGQLILSEVNDIIIPSSGETALDIAKASCVLKNGVALGGDLNILKTKFNGVYLSYYLNSNKKKDIARYSQGISVIHLYSAQLKLLEISFPTLPEQTKIANFLSLVDKKIENGKLIIDNLKLYKRGLMQQIFSQKLRFKPVLSDSEGAKNGQNFPDWQEKRLGEVAKFENGKAHEKDVSNNGKYVIVNSKFISSEGKVCKLSNFQYMPLFKNDVVMVMSDVPNGKALAKCFFIEENDKFSLNQRICVIRSKQVNSKLLFYLLNRNKYYLKFDSGVGQTNLRKSEVLNCTIVFPNSDVEQKKIADFLSALDKKIENEKLKLENLKAWKKGLLQKMFI